MFDADHPRAPAMVAENTAVAAGRQHGLVDAALLDEPRSGKRRKGQPANQGFPSDRDRETPTIEPHLGRSDAVVKPAIHPGLQDGRFAFFGRAHQL